MTSKPNERREHIQSKIVQLQQAASTSRFAGIPAGIAYIWRLSSVNHIFKNEIYLLE